MHTRRALQTGSARVGILGGSTAQQKAWLESGGERGRQSVRAKSGLQPIAWVLEGLEEWTIIQVF